MGSSIASIPIVGNVTNALGLTSPEVAGTDMTGINNQISYLRDQQQSTGPTASQKQYGIMANDAMGRALAGIGGQKGFSASNRNAMLSQVMPNMQMNAAAQGGLLGLQERQGINQNIASMLMGGAGLQAQQNQANLASQNAAAGRLSGLMGSGVSGYATGYGLGSGLGNNRSIT